MLKKIRNFMAEEKGQGMAEYGLILALIACVCILALTGIGTQIQAKFNEVVTGLS
jgi:pilus assembly protein Flp/PilA